MAAMKHTLSIIMQTRLLKDAAAEWVDASLVHHVLTVTMVLLHHLVMHRILETHHSPPQQLPTNSTGVGTAMAFGR